MGYPARLTTAVSILAGKLRYRRITFVKDRESADMFEADDRDRSGTNSEMRRLTPQVGLSLRDAVREAKREAESEIIRAALEKHRWNRRRTAESLSISYRSLMYKMKDCNLREDTNGQGRKRPEAV